MSNKIRTVLICVITAVWAMNFSAPIVIRDYTPPSEVHIVFMAVVGLLSLGFKKNEENGDDKRKQPDREELPK